MIGFLQTRANKGFKILGRTRLRAGYGTVGYTGATWRRQAGRHHGGRPRSPCLALTICAAWTMAIDRARHDRAREGRVQVGRFTFVFRPHRLYEVAELVRSSPLRPWLRRGLSADGKASKNRPAAGRRPRRSRLRSRALFSAWLQDHPDYWIARSAVIDAYNRYEESHVPTGERLTSWLPPSLAVGLNLLPPECSASISSELGRTAPSRCGTAPSATPVPRRRQAGRHHGAGQDHHAWCPHHLRRLTMKTADLAHFQRSANPPSGPAATFTSFRPPIARRGAGEGGAWSVADFAFGYVVDWNLSGWEGVKNPTCCPAATRAGGLRRGALSAWVADQPELAGSALANAVMEAYQRHEEATPKTGETPSGLADTTRRPGLPPVRCRRKPAARWPGT